MAGRRCLIEESYFTTILPCNLYDFSIHREVNGIAAKARTTTWFQRQCLSAGGEARPARLSISGVALLDDPHPMED